MQNVTDDMLLPLADLRRHLPVKRSKRTLFHWATQGVPKDDPNDPTKERIKLPAVKIAGVYHSSVNAFREFVRKQNPQNERDNRD